MAFNKVILIGNLCSDPELKQTQGGTSVCSFNIAINRYSKEPDAKKVDFFTVVAWQAKAEFVSRYFKKGQAIVVVGRLENREWTDKQGNKRISTEIIAEEISFAGGKEVQSAEGRVQSEENKPYMPTPYFTGNSQNFEEIPGDESLPF
jgi:single-strand DNA-binding protein